MGRRYRDIVRAQSTAKRSARAVMNILADYADDEGVAWPGHERIAAESGLSERTVTRVIASLIALGEIEIAEPQRQHNTPKYRICISVDVPQGRQIGESEMIQGRQFDIQGRQPDTSRVDSLTSRVDNLTEAGSQTVYSDLTRAGAGVREPQEPKIQEPEVIRITRPPARPADPPRQSTGPRINTPICRKGEPKSRDQAMFVELCNIMALDRSIISDDRCVGIANLVRTLIAADYGLDDLRRFMPEVWAHDWRWRKSEQTQRPTLGQIREEIGKLRAPIPVDMPIFDTPSRSRGAEAVDRVFDALEQEGVIYDSPRNSQGFV